MIGFVPQNHGRRPVYTQGGVKMGYVRSDGVCVFWENLEGRTIARIIQQKEIPGGAGIQSACGGSWVPDGYCG